MSTASKRLTRIDDSPFALPRVRTGTAGRQAISKQDLQELLVVIEANRAKAPSKRLPPLIKTDVPGGSAAGLAYTWDEAMTKANRAAAASGVRHQVVALIKDSESRERGFRWLYRWKTVEVRPGQISLD